MTPKEMAEDLFDRFHYNFDNSLSHELSKECALITLDEIVLSFKYPPKPTIFKEIVFFETMKYYDEVKQELEKL